MPRIRSFRFVRDGHDNYILTFIIDELSSITHRCLEALKPGDSFLVGTTEKNSVFQVSLNHELVEALKTSKPDRSNGSHHVEVARLQQGVLVVRTASGGLALPAVVAEPPVSDQTHEFWNAVGELIGAYPHRPHRMTANSDAVRLRGVIGSNLRDFSHSLSPSQLLGNSRICRERSMG